jgi:hypothetical protein
MLIFNDEQRLRAGIKSLSKRCSYCSKALSEYPLIMNDDAGLAVFHAACAAALATEIIVDLYTFFRPPAPYHRIFVLDPQHSAHEQKARCERKE